MDFNLLYAQMARMLLLLILGSALIGGLLVWGLPLLWAWLKPILALWLST